jgi:NarL family two-component system response regulator LiaR
MIVDDHAMLRKGLRLFLKGFDDLKLAGEADGGEQAVRLCSQIQPDVILMDMLMPGLDGVEATRLIRGQYPHVQVIAVTSFHNPELVEKAIQAGAIGYLLKNVSAAELARAIREAHAGRSTLAPEAAQVLVQATRQRASQPDYGLTERETEVLTLLVEGLSNADIADRLVISLATAKYHVRNILAKLGASSRTEAVALALQKNLVRQTRRDPA